MSFFSSVYYKFKKLSIKLLREHHKSSDQTKSTPEYKISMGVAIGFFCAWIPLMLQYVWSFILCRIFRANWLISLLPILITNPATFIPINIFNYIVGRAIIGGPNVAAFKGAIKEIINISQTEGFGAAAKFFLSEFWQYYIPMAFGSLLIGLILAVASYFITKPLVKTIFKVVRDKKAARDATRKAAAQKNKK